MGKLNVTYTDFGGETTTTGLRLAVITAANLDAVVAAVGTLMTAMDGITVGQRRKFQILQADTVVSLANPLSALAQRETKWLITYHDDVSGKQYQSEIGTADYLLNIVPGTEFADLTDGGVIQAFVTAFQAVVKAPDDLSHAVTIDSIKAVSRNT